MPDNQQQNVNERTSYLSFGSAGSILSIGSIGSVLSIRSAFSVGSINANRALFQNSATDEQEGQAL